jgi:hypothetical protein
VGEAGLLGFLCTRSKNLVEKWQTGNTCSLSPSAEILIVPLNLLVDCFPSGEVRMRMLVKGKRGVSVLSAVHLIKVN